MNTTDYNNKINKLLLDKDTYSVLNVSNTDNIKQQADKILQNLYRKNYITFKQLKKSYWIYSC